MPNTSRSDLLGQACTMNEETISRLQARVDFLQGALHESDQQLQLLAQKQQEEREGWTYERRNLTTHCDRLIKENHEFRHAFQAVVDTLEPKDTPVVMRGNSRVDTSLTSREAALKCGLRKAIEVLEGEGVYQNTVAYLWGILRGDQP